jgi:LuxR family maltose regulon positive regulatory protein
MQGRDDVAGFIAGFAGDDRYVVDYLAEEVLARQPDRVQIFLLQTSILSRLSGPLCDAVTEQGGGKDMLEALDRGNLFWSRSTTAAGGTATTICSRTCCRRGC